MTDAKGSTMNAYVQLCLQLIYRRSVDGPNWLMRGLFVALCLLAPISIAAGATWQVAWMVGVVLPVGMIGIMCGATS